MCLFWGVAPRGDIISPVLVLPLLGKPETVPKLMLDQSVLWQESALPKRGASIRGSRFVLVTGGRQRLLEVLGYIGACHHLVVIYLCWQSADLAETIKTVGR